MTTVTRGTTVVPALVSLAVLLAALTGCGPFGVTQLSQLKATGDEDHTIGLLLSDNHVARWERFDRPLVERRVTELCPHCTVDAVNAEGQVNTQLQQVNAMVSRGVRSLIIDPVDSEAIRSGVEWAHAAGIPVVAYDRLAQGPVSGYASHDNVRVGTLQAEALLDALGDRARGSRVVMMNGPPSDANAALLRRGALAVLKGRVHVSRSYDTPNWAPEVAYANTAAAIAQLGAHQIDAVYAANDSIASGVIAALRAAHLDPLPPVTGQDAEISAVQRVVEGEQYMTVHKPFRTEANAAAEMAVALARGQPLDAIASDEVHNGDREIPAVLAAPISVTVDDVESTVVDTGLYTVDEICTPRFASACSRVGLR